MLVTGVPAVDRVPAVLDIFVVSRVSDVAGIPDVAVAGGPVIPCVPAVSDALLCLLTLLLLATCCCYCPCYC